MNDALHKCKLAELVFEGLGAPRLHIGSQGLLALYSQNRLAESPWTSAPVALWCVQYMTTKFWRTAWNGAQLLETG